MEDLLLVDVLNCCQNAGDQESGLVFAEFVGVGQSASQVGSGQQIHHQVEVVPIVEGTHHVGNEFGLETFQNFTLV